MNAIDSLLRILIQQEGTELRLIGGRSPRLFKGDAELPLTIPVLSAERVREVLGDLWVQNEAALRERGQVSLKYASPELGRFAVTLVVREPAAIEASLRPDPRVGADLGGAAESDRGSEGGHRQEKASVVRERRPDDGNELPAALVGLLARAAARGASDVHLSERADPIARVNGGLEVIDAGGELPLTALLDGPEALAELRAGGSVDRALDIPSVGRVRVNVYTTSDGLCAALRILKREAPTLANLNLPPQLEPLVDLPHGLVLACGPTGSGKSSTLAALVQQALRARPQLVVTLEDPIEYVIRPLRPPGLVRQREVGTHVRDFATGLRDALREDPDILLIGEMRDPETIGLALTAAETGHLVFASLHSRSAASAVERMVDIYPPERQRQIRVQIADSLRAVISQRLLPTSDGGGRVPVIELLRVTYGVANLIREGRTAQIASALQAGANEGMLVLERSLADLVRANRIRRESAVAVANDPSTLAEYLRVAGVST